MTTTALESLGPFQQLSEGGRQLLRRGAVLAQCGPPAPILQPGQSISGAYFVVRGRLRVYAVAPDGTIWSNSDNRMAISFTPQAKLVRVLKSAPTSGSAPATGLTAKAPASTP